MTAAIYCLAAVFTIVIVARAAIEEQGSAASAKLSPNECRRLGFITEELYCNTCDLLYASYAGAARASAADNAAASDDGEEGGDEGDAEVGTEVGDDAKPPSPADILRRDCLSCCMPVSKGLARTGKKGKKHPAPVLYENAKIEINYQKYQQSEEWQTFGEVQVPKMFPATSAAVPAAVVVVPGHSYQNYIHLYKAGLDPATDSPSFSLDVLAWDQNKILEFLNHSIASSPLIKEEMEKLVK